MFCNESLALNLLTFLSLFKAWFLLFFAAAERTDFLKGSKVWFTTKVSPMERLEKFQKIEISSFLLKLSTKRNVTDIAMTHGV